MYMDHINLYYHSGNGHPEKRTTPYNVTDLVAQIELRSVLLMDKYLQEADISVFVLSKNE